MPSIARYEIVICELCKGKGETNSRSIVDGITSHSTCSKCGGHGRLHAETLTVYNTVDAPRRFSLQIIDSQKDIPND